MIVHWDGRLASDISSWVDYIAVRPALWIDISSNDVPVAICQSEPTALSNELDDWFNMPFEDVLATIDKICLESEKWKSAKDVPYTINNFPIQPALDLREKDVITNLNLPNPAVNGRTKDWQIGYEDRDYDEGVWHRGA